MSLKLSVKDINFLRKFHSFLKIPLISPWYDFDKKSCSNPTGIKIYATFLLLLVTSRVILAEMDEGVEKLKERLPFTQKITWYITFAITVGITVNTIIANSFCCCTRWKKLFSNFHHIDFALGNVGKEEKKLVKNFYCGLFAKHLFFFLVGGVQAFIWYKFLDSTLKTYLLLFPLEFVYEFYTILFFKSLVDSLEVRFKDLNREISTVLTYPKLAYKLKVFVENYRILGEMIVLLNNIFGYQILLIFFHFGVEMVSTFTFTLMFLMNRNDAFCYYLLSASSLWFLWLLYNLLQIIFPITSTAQHSQKFIDLLYQIQNRFAESSTEMETLIRLVNYAKNFTREFNAAGFLKVDKTVIFTVMANVATYVIIVFQLDYSEYQDLARNQSFTNTNS